MGICKLSGHNERRFHKRVKQGKIENAKKRKHNLPTIKDFPYFLLK